MEYPNDYGRFCFGFDLETGSPTLDSLRIRPGVSCEIDMRPVLCPELSDRKRA